MDPRRAAPAGAASPTATPTSTTRTRSSSAPTSSSADPARRASSSRVASSSGTACRRRRAAAPSPTSTRSSTSTSTDPEHREEGGTPAIVESIRAGLVFALKEAVGVETIREREEDFIDRAIATWSAEPGIGILGNPNLPRLSIVSFTVRHDGRYLHHNFVVAVLNDLFGIQSRGGCSCAGPYGHRLLGIDIETSHAFEREIARGCEGIKPGWVRVNFNYFISEAVFDYIIEAVAMVARDGWRLLPWYRFEPATGMWRHADGSPEPPLSLHDVTFSGEGVAYPAHRHQAGEEALAGHLEEAARILARSGRRAGCSAGVGGPAARRRRLRVAPLVLASGRSPRGGRGAVATVRCQDTVRPQGVLMSLGAKRRRGYARISHDPEGDQLGVNRQMADCQALAAARGWPVAEVYIDDDRSAYSGKPRPEYRRMLDDIADGRSMPSSSGTSTGSTASPASSRSSSRSATPPACARGLGRRRHRPLDPRRPLPRAYLGCRGPQGERRQEPAHHAQAPGAGPGRHRPAEVPGPSATGTTGAPSSRPRRPRSARLPRASALATASAALASDWNARGIRTVRGSDWTTQSSAGCSRAPACPASARFTARSWPRRVGADPDARGTAQLRAILGNPDRLTRRTVRRYLLSGGLLRCGLCDAALVARPRADGDRRYVCAKGPALPGCGGSRSCPTRSRSSSPRPSCTGSTRPSWPRRSVAPRPGCRDGRRSDRPGGRQGPADRARHARTASSTSRSPSTSPPGSRSRPASTPASAN